VASQNQTRKEEDQIASSTTRRKSKAALIVVLGFISSLLVLFGWFGGEVLEGETLTFDNAVREAIHGHSTPMITKMMVIMSFIGSPVFLFGLGICAAVGFWLTRRKRDLAIFLIIMAGEVLLDLSLKGFYERVRPEPYFGYLLPSSFAFPSGHALGSFCFFGILAILISRHLDDRKTVWLIRTLAVLLILIIGFSRVYLGVHYPTDVIAGYFAGLIWTATVLIASNFLWSGAGSKDPGEVGYNVPS
jgi:undecaprenyl-diphosphatase